jgi:drug/metabolite transporter (DMT)-like permease
MTDTAAPLPGVHPLDPRHRKPWLGYTLYLTAAMLFGINGSVSKAIMLTGISPERLSQFRSTSAFLILLVIVAVTNRPALRIRRGEWRLIVAYGILGVTMTQYLYFIGIRLLPVGVALLIEFTAPILVLLWARFGDKEHVRPTAWIGLILALLGLGLVGEVWRGLTLNGLGVLASFGAAASLAVYYILGEKGLRDRDPVSLTTWGFGAATLFWALVAPWWTFPWNSLRGSTTLGNGLELPIAVLAVYMVALGTVLSFALVLFSLRHIRASQASAIGMTEPLFAAAVAFILLNEVLTSIQLVGAVTVLAGVFMAEQSRWRAATGTPTP